MPLFQIETYEVSSYLNRPAGQTRPSRVLKMTGPVLYHGIQNRATFGFHPSFGGTWGSPVAGYVSNPGYAGLSVVGWFPLQEFEYYYDILRSEKPLHVIYELRDPDAYVGYLREVGLGTATEPIGEGPSESTSAISAVLAQHLTDASRVVVPMPVAADLPQAADLPKRSQSDG